MNEQDNAPHDDSRRCRRTGWGRRTRLGLAAAALLGLGAVLGGLAALSAPAAAHLFGARACHGSCSLEQMTERALDPGAWVLARADASETQEEQMDEVIRTLVGDLAPQSHDLTGFPSVGVLDVLSR